MRVHTDRMKATQKMIVAASRAEYNYYQRDRTDAGRLVPTPDEIIKVMLDAALNLVDAADAPSTAGRTSGIVTAHQPTRRR